jgi:hypothetical protein
MAWSSGCSGRHACLGAIPPAASGPPTLARGKRAERFEGQPRRAGLCFCLRSAPASQGQHRCGRDQDHTARAPATVQACAASSALAGKEPVLNPDTCRR